MLLLVALVAMTVQGRHNGMLPTLSSSAAAAIIDTNTFQSWKMSPLMRSILKLRGGDDDEDEDATDDEEEYDDESDDEALEESSSGLDYAAILEQVIDVTTTKIVPVIVEYSTKSLTAAKRTSISIYQAINRAIRAAMEGEEADESDNSDDEDSDDEGEEEFSSVMDKVLMITKKSISLVKRMMNAALAVPDDEESEEEEGKIVDDDEEEEVAAAEPTKEEETVKEPETTEPDSATTTADQEEVEDVTDFGYYLAEAYEVDDQRNSGKTKGPIILGGSLQDALEIARQQARMLLVFIPSERPKGERGGLSFFGGKKGSAETEEKDKVALESLLSNEVGKAANKKARKKQGDSNDLGSFAIWGCKSGSAEATTAIKRLKVKETSVKGEKRPILCAVYPAVGAMGSDKISAKVLAQHHCNPPMKAASMASWMNALRKRHGKQYQNMQTELKELQLYQERKEGYVDSVQSDNERKLKEAQEEAERKAQEIKEAARQAEIDARRQELQQSLPEDMKNGSNVKKIAIRFPDGRSGQRGFASDQPLSMVFNWVDAMFEIERETVVLTTMNGKQTFSWDDDETKSGKTLEDVGLNKMTAFRVTEA